MHVWEESIPTFCSPQNTKIWKTPVVIAVGQKDNICRLLVVFVHYNCMISACVGSVVYLCGAFIRVVRPLIYMFVFLIKILSVMCAR